MKGLLIKDFYSISNYKRQYAMTLLFTSIWAVCFKSFSFLAAFVILLGGMMVLSVMSIDEAVHFNRYALTMPISVKTLVKEKYVLTGIGIGTGTILALIVETIALSITWFEGLEEYVVVIGLSVMFLVAYTVTLPVAFKYGVEKARYFYIAIMLVFGLGVSGLVYLTKDTPVIFWDNLSPMASDLVLAGGTLIFLAVVFVISYRVSLRVACNKEW